VSLSGVETNGFLMYSGSPPLTVGAEYIGFQFAGVPVEHPADGGLTLNAGECHRVGLSKIGLYGGLLIPVSPLDLIGRGVTSTA